MNVESYSFSDKIVITIMYAMGVIFTVFVMIGVRDKIVNPLALVMLFFGFIYLTILIRMDIK